MLRTDCGSLDMACGRGIVWLPVIAHGDAGKASRFGGSGVTQVLPHLVNLQVRAVLKPANKEVLESSLCHSN